MRTLTAVGAARVGAARVGAARVGAARVGVARVGAASRWLWTAMKSFRFIPPILSL